MNAKEKFFELLAHVPSVEKFWDKGKSELDVDLFESSFSVISSGELQMAKFFAAILFNDNERYGFDLIDAVSKVDTSHRKLIMEWIARPFWP